MLTQIGLILLCLFLLVVLVKAADFIEDGFVLLARKLKLNEFFVGFGILGVVTTLPELAIVFNTKSVAPEISLANLLGGCFILLTLIIGLAVIEFKEFSFTGKFNEFDLVFALSIIALSVILLIDKELSFIDGIILLNGYFLYILHIAQEYTPVKKYSLEHAHVNALKLFTLMSKAVFGVILLLVSSSLLVDNLIELADSFAIPNALMGLLFLSIGTNIPELVLLYSAEKKGKNAQKLILGAFIGSATANIGILGVLGIISEGFVIGEFNSIIPLLFMLSVSVLIFLVFSFTERNLTRKEGIVLTSLYFVLFFSEAIMLLSRI